ncbi:uncharacterized protein LOC107800805 isoform X1 [Nicotiana tabacum]|uniref:Uncharacterized protein LOC107800805 isoform X1 n=2 Tax=Nicotiana TaxID=4085 RepID=A0A1S4ASI9_TOBAC|nr:PREDICTED: uncharacterized protein LOC104250043 isoform X1 [Nicotiana sylvestris]XP_016479525.1 PREDICTED: uncharacterized protein LOC107800805 isoform X1 [Nicotiana tabacum]
MRIALEEKLSEAKKEIEATEKKLFESKEEIKAMEEKMLEASKDMDAKIEDKVKLGINAYLKSLGITIGSIKKLSGDEQVSDNSMDDHQQSLSPVSLVHTKMVNIIKKTRVSEVDTKKKKRVSVKKLQGSWAVAFTFLDFLLYVVCFFLSSVASIIFIIILFFF